MVDLTEDGRSVRTAAGDRWRSMLDAARGQALRLGDPDWSLAADSYADRIDSFRAGQRTDQNVLDLLTARTGPTAGVMEIGAGAGRLSLPLARHGRELLAVEPSPSMADVLAADVRDAGLADVRIVRVGWEELDGVTTERRMWCTAYPELRTSCYG